MIELKVNQLKAAWAAAEAKINEVNKNRRPYAYHTLQL